MVRPGGLCATWTKRIQKDHTEHFHVVSKSTNPTEKKYNGSCQTTQKDQSHKVVPSQERCAVEINHLHEMVTAITGKKITKTHGIKISRLDFNKIDKCER